MGKPSKRSVINRLLDDALLFPFLCPGIKREPGDAIKRLSKEDREALKDATAEDFSHWWIPKLCFPRKVKILGHEVVDVPRNKRRHHDSRSRISSHDRQETGSD